jgi:hypothetical protein
LAKQTITLTNLLTNPSFEKTGWTANSACSVSYATSPKHSGSYSLKVTSTSSSKSLIVTSDTYAIRKNHIYYISVYFYETVNVCSEMQCYWPIAEPLVGIAKVDKTKLNQWQRLSWHNVRANWNDN